MANVTMTAGRLVDTLRRARSDSLVRNSLYLMASTVTTGGLGYVYWIFAAHLFAKQSVGLGSGVVSMCTTISLMTYLGPYAMIIEQLPGKERSPEWTKALYRVSAGTVIVTCILTAAVVPAILLSSNYRTFYTGAGSILVLLAGTGASTLLNLLAAAFIAARQASRMLVMMTYVSLAKLLLLLSFAHAGAIGLVDTWVISAVLGVLVGACWLIPEMGLGRQQRYGYHRRASFSQIGQGTGGHARHRRDLALPGREYLKRLIGQHLTSVGGFLTPLLLPVLVVMRLGTTANANFYVTWMMGSFFFMVSPSVSTAVFAEGSRIGSNLSKEVFKALRMTGLLLVPAILAAIIGGRIVLRLFGATYASAGYELLIILAISAIPDAVSNVAVAIWRITRHLGYSATLNLGILVTTLASAWILMPQLGIDGVGFAWGGIQLAGAIASLPAYAHMRKQVEPRDLKYRGAVRL
jgi:O-antigen/teichoic acid export membrane protein